MSLNLRIKVYNGQGTAQQQKMMRFGEQMSISECLREIRDKTGVGGLDYGLFQSKSRRNREVKPRWLKNDQDIKLLRVRLRGKQKM